MYMSKAKEESVNQNPLCLLRAGVGRGGAQHSAGAAGAGAGGRRPAAAGALCALCRYAAHVAAGHAWRGRRPGASRVRGFGVSHQGFRALRRCAHVAACPAWRGRQLGALRIRRSALRVCAPSPLRRSRWAGHAMWTRRAMLAMLECGGCGANKHTASVCLLLRSSQV